MLNKELDVLEILKKLRVSKFTSDIYLRQEHRDLVMMHQDYKVSLEAPAEGRNDEGDVFYNAIDKVHPSP